MRKRKHQPNWFGKRSDPLSAGAIGPVENARDHNAGDFVRHWHANLLYSSQRIGREIFPRVPGVLALHLLLTGLDYIGAGGLSFFS